MNDTSPYFIFFTKILKEITPDFTHYAFNLESDLNELGISSMDRMESIHELICQFKLQIPMIAFAGKMKINDIIGVITDQA